MNWFSRGYIMASGIVRCCVRMTATKSRKMAAIQLIGQQRHRALKCPSIQMIIWKIIYLNIVWSLYEIIHSSLSYLNIVSKDNSRFEVRRKDMKAWLIIAVVHTTQAVDQSCLLIFIRSSNLWFFIYSFVFCTFYGYITNSQCDQLPDGLIAQLVDMVEHCTDIAKVKGSNPVSGFDLIYRLLKLCV